MSDMAYTLKPVKVCLDGDDCNVFDAYLVGYGRRGFCEQNSGGYEHPHFTKPEAMRVMRTMNLQLLLALRIYTITLKIKIKFSVERIETIRSFLLCI